MKYYKHTCPACGSSVKVSTKLEKQWCPFHSTAVLTVVETLTNEVLARGGVFYKYTEVDWEDVMWPKDRK